MDGVSLLQPLARETVQERTLYWKFQGQRQRAVRRGRWKYYRLRDMEFLYDLQADSMERANRAMAEPAVLAELRGAWETWNAGMALRRELKRR
jgi:arylsulfatase A-like enzyme